MDEIEYLGLECFLKNELRCNLAFKTKWCAISGAPCSGKTTLINELANRGCQTNPDIPRLYIENEIKKGKNKMQVRENKSLFRRIIFLKMFENISSLPVNRIIFHDYALPDNIAFYEMDNVEIASDLWQSVEMYKYSKVFLLEPLPYWRDDVRIENEVYQKQIHKKLIKTYRELNYEIIIVPVSSIRERLNIILSNIKDIWSPES